MFYYLINAFIDENVGVRIFWRKIEIYIPYSFLFSILFFIDV